MSSHVTIDLGRGINHKDTVGVGSGSASPPSLPFLRRRKGLVAILILSITLLLFVNRSHLSGAQSSIRWVKDSMRPADAGSAPPSASLPNDFGVGIAQSALGGGGSDGAGTEAFRKLAAEQGYSDAEIQKLAAGTGGSVTQGSRPTSSEQLLLFFHALSNPHYTVPSWERTWRTQLIPLSEKGFVRSLNAVGSSADDVELFKTNRGQWNALHRSKSTVTVFSKSYCPYSRRAKELLNSLGAKYNVIEVDLRTRDAEQTQAALAALSGHHTFPAVFAGDKLLGGFDDIQSMHQLKVLKGVLQGAGAL